MCNCKSYNKPEWGGETPEVIVPKPDWSDRISSTICLDACIADKILELWHNNIQTLGSCCGHNQAPASIVIEQGQDIDLTKKIVPDWTIHQWQLVTL